MPLLLSHCICLRFPPHSCVAAACLQSMQNCLTCCSVLGLFPQRGMTVTTVTLTINMREGHLRMGTTIWSVWFVLTLIPYHVFAMGFPRRENTGCLLPSRIALTRLITTRSADYVQVSISFCTSTDLFEIRWLYKLLPALCNKNNCILVHFWTRAGHDLQGRKWPRTGHERVNDHS